MSTGDDTDKLRRQRDFDDLNNELAGRGSKIKRFTGDGAAAVHAGKSDDKERADALFTLSELAQATQQRLDAINQRLDELDRSTAEELRLAQEHLEELRRSANRTRDGRLVFRSEADGRYYAEDGSEVDPADIDLEGWRDAGPSREAWLEAQERQRQAQERRDRFEDAQERANGGTLTEEELDELERDLDVLEADAGHNAVAADAADPSVAKGPLFQPLNRRG
ncbi:MAG: hypothetical protein AB7P52_05250 [Alphaproteobacteria bacterium]